MRAKRCEKGHFYDAERYKNCPECEARNVSDWIPARFLEIGSLAVTGSGSIGRVFKISGEKEYALKVIECGSDDKKYKNALYEVEILKHLNGTLHTVRMCDSECVEKDGMRTIYILQEYHTTLTEYLLGKAVSLGEALKIVIGICDALLECKQAGVIQLDIQPKNIYVDSSGLVKVGDFSSSLFWKDIRSNCVMRGTLAFMAPEVYREGCCSEQSDIYSVGLVLYSLLNGKVLPFMNSDSKELAIYKRLAGTPFPKINFLPDVFQGEMEKLIQRACAYKAEERFQSFEDLKEKLENVLRFAVRCGIKDEILYSNTMIFGENGIDFGKNSTSPVFFDADSVAFTAALFDTNSSAALPVSAAPSASPKPSMHVPSVPAMPSMSPAQDMICAQPAEGVLYCKKCHNPVMPGQYFCNYCGSRVKNTSLDLKKVQFSAIAPKKMVKGDYSMIEIVMYEGAFRHVVDQMLKEADEPVGEARSGILKVQDGSVIRICLTSPNIEIEDNEEIRQWQGDYLNFSFAILLPEDYKQRQVVFHANVYVNDVIAVRLKFIAKCFSLWEQKLSVSREDILSAFISYASQDRHHVAAIIQGMKKIRPDMDVFFDVESLRSGEDWEKALYSEIEKRDILFLCWSHFAQQSKWVEAEWRYALEQKGIDCIEPVPIEPSNVCPPPEELKQKHFNDRLLYIIHAND